ncbi:MAG: energy-coupling factor transporter transmembrane protein EcfT [Candidatus Bathyarchaeota archaeon]|nr:energy-coupling factor transporter transmembrane protein EcfT [Candidatus Bathyarchaeota archaeon]
MSVFDGLKFRKVSSPIHNLDPRVKFVYVIIIFIVAILFSQIIPLLALFLLQIPFVLLARVERQWVRSLRGAAFLAAFIFIVNIATTYFMSGYTITGADIERATSMTLRFVVLVESFSVFFLTTSPDHLGLALEESRVPYEFAFAFTTAVRFVPVLAEEAQTIMDAQKARGLELEKGSLLKRIRNYIPVLIPLIVSAIRRSLELAEAMESRAWGAVKRRTNLYALKLHLGDYLLLALSIGILIVAIYSFVMAIPIPTITSFF